MPPVKNVIFSSTRQWNPGDEFIQFGCQNLISNLINFNSILFNRNPQIRGLHDTNHPFLNANHSHKFNTSVINAFIGKYIKLNFWDNSFKNNGEYSTDFCVISGSPEWSGRRLEPLFKYIEKNKIPTFFLGLGGNKNLNQNTLSTLDWNTLKNAKFISTRDSTSQKALSVLNSKQLPCPALFATNSTKSITKLKKIGLVYATNKSTENNRVSKQTENHLKYLYSNLMQHYECEFVCHYVDELESIEKDFQNATYHYHYDAAQYEQIFKQFDCIISPRIHGCGIASSLGIPNIHIAHSDRSETTKGFKSFLHAVDTDFNLIKEQIEEIKLNIHDLNSSIISHKKNTLYQYLDLIKNEI